MNTSLNLNSGTQSDGESRSHPLRFSKLSFLASCIRNSGMALEELTLCLGAGELRPEERQTAHNRLLPTIKRVACMYWVCHFCTISKFSCTRGSMSALVGRVNATHPSDDTSPFKSIKGPFSGRASESHQVTNGCSILHVTFARHLEERQDGVYRKRAYRSGDSASARMLLSNQTCK